MCQSPEGVARQRYNNAFSSSIFAAPTSSSGIGFIPAGKRRDQTTSEMFGNYAEKDLRGCPKTFMPKEDVFSARQKKQIFLSSGVLPNSSYPPTYPPTYAGQSQYSEEGQAPPPFQGHDDDEDDAVDTNLMRQRELQSKLFGRSTPAIDVQQLHDPKTKLTPNDFNWHSHPENVHGANELRHDERAYREKCSKVFDHTSPEVQADYQRSQRLDRQEEQRGVDQRRNNVYYSDLFGRAAHEQAKENQGNVSARRMKPQCDPEERIVTHQDWTDSKTELMHARGGRPEAPYLRKSVELNQARIFPNGVRAAWEPPEHLEPVSHDNSQKLKTTMTATTSEIHQAHLKSSVLDERFYEDAESMKHWEVVELHVSGLGRDACDGDLKKLCSGFDLHLVKVAVEMDPVRNLCKGRAKVMVRYNPKRDTINGLIQRLQDSQLRVEL